jgi:hypothetical protein
MGSGMKINGAEFKEWYEHHLPKGFSLEGTAFLIFDRSGGWAIGDADIIDTAAAGYLVWDGDPEDNPSPRGLSATKAIREWKRADSEKVLMIAVPSSREDEIHAALTKLDVKILSK